MMTQLRKRDLSSAHMIVAGMGALLSIVQPSLAPLVAGAIVAAYLLARLVLKKRATQTPANLSLGLLAGVCLINPAISVRPVVSLPIAMQMVVGIGLLLSISGWATSRERNQQAMIGLAVVGILLVAIAPFTVDWITDKYEFLPSSFYDWFLPLSRRVIHPNILAGAAAVLLVTLIGYQRFTWRGLGRREHLFFVFVSVCLAALLIVLQSRGAMMGVLLGLGSLWLLSLRVRTGVMLIVGIVAVLALLVLAGADLTFLVDSSASIRGASARLEIWAHATELVRDFPLTGIGFGNFQRVTELFYPFLVAGPDQSHAHNLLLQIAVDTGLIGLVLWLSCLLLVIACCVGAWRLATANRDRWLCGMSAGLLCGQLTMIVHGLTDASLWATRPSMIVWGLWGLALALALPAAKASCPETNEA